MPNFNHKENGLFNHLELASVNSVAFCKVFFSPDISLPIFHLNFKVNKKCSFFFC